MFVKNFGKYVCEGDRIETEVDGFRLVARIERDCDYGIDDDDSHNVDQNVTGCDEEQQSRLLAAREAWFKDEWWYGGVVVEFWYAGKIWATSSIWGVEVNYPNSDNGYLRDCANEMVEEALNEGKKALETFVREYQTR